MSEDNLENRVSESKALIKHEAYALLKKGDFDDAVLKFIESGIKKSEAYDTVAFYIYHNRKKDSKDEVKKCEEKLIEFCQIANTGFGWCRLAEFYKEKNNDVEAAKCYEAALPKLNGDAAAAALNAIKIYKKLGNTTKVKEIAGKYNITEFMDYKFDS